jgi:arylformamidase
MAVYPGDPPVVVEACATVTGDGYAVARVGLSDQAGTHVETQAHFGAGRTLGEEPLERFIGTAVVVDVPCGQVEVAHLRPYAGAVRGAELLLLRSGYGDGVEGIEPDDPRRPRLSLEAVRWIVAQGVRLLGIDCFDFDEGPAYLGHKYLFAHGVLVVEGLVNLGALGAGPVRLFVIPLKLEGTGGAPCRVFAVDADG